MSFRRSLAPFALTLASVLLVHCSSETPGTNPGTAGTMSAGAGNAASGASGAAGSAAGDAGSGGTTGGAGAGAGVGGAGSGAGGSGTSGSAGTGGGGASGAAGAGAGGIGGSVAGGGAGGAAAGAGGAGGGAGGADGGSAGAGGSGGGGAFTLTSSKLTPDTEMPSDFTCAGDAHSPPFEWTGAPAGTMSFAMVFVDTTIIDANMADSRGYHSAIWDIPASTNALPENLPSGATLTTPVMAKQFDPLSPPGYLGPCPNNGAAPADVYEFRLYALPVATLTGTLTNVRSILQSILDANPLGSAVLRVRSDATGTLR